MIKHFFQKFLRNKECSCMHPPFHYQNFHSNSIGTDITNGRYGEVTIKKCKKCGKLWLHYLVEYEAFTKSGRWYRGLISESKAKKISPESAVNYLEELDWHFYGGSYFDTTGRISNDHNINVDL